MNACAANLAETYLTKMALGMPIIIGRDTIEKDKRKQNKAVRELIEAGLVCEGKNDDGDPVLTILPKAVEDIQAATITDDLLFQLWETQRERYGSSSSNYMLPYVLVLGHYRSKTDLSVIKGLLEDPSKVDWHVCRGHNDSPHRVDESLTDAIAFDKMAEARRDCRGGSWSMEVLTLVTTPGLQERVKEQLFRDTLAHNYPRQLAWGLQHFDILTEEEAKVVKNGLSDALGMHIRGLHFSDEKPEEWSDSLQKSTDSLVSQLSDIQQRLAVCIKIERGVQAMGGWDLFLQQYREALEVALRRQEAEEEAA